MTVADLINLTLRDLAVLGAGEVASAEDSADALLIVNDFIDAMKLRGLNTFTITRTLWPLTGASSYTIGVGGTINVSRPVRPQDITNIGYVDTSLTPNAEYLQGPLLTDDQYAAIVNKTMTGLIPARWYYRPTNPLGTLIPWPIANGSNLSGSIYTSAEVSEFTSAAQTIIVAPGYRKYVRKGLAIELAPTFHVPVTPDMRNAFEEIRADVMRANQRLVDVDLGEVALMFGGAGPSNVYTDT